MTYKLSKRPTPTTFSLQLQGHTLYQSQIVKLESLLHLKKSFFMDNPYKIEIILIYYAILIMQFIMLF